MHLRFNAKASFHKQVDRENGLTAESLEIPMCRTPQLTPQVCRYFMSQTAAYDRPERVATSVCEGGQGCVCCVNLAARWRTGRFAVGTCL